MTFRSIWTSSIFLLPFLNISIHTLISFANKYSSLYGGRSWLLKQLLLNLLHSFGMKLDILQRFKKIYQEPVIIGILKFDGLHQICEKGYRLE